VMASSTDLVVLASKGQDCRKGNVVGTIKERCGRFPGPERNRACCRWWNGSKTAAWPLRA
jgi:hypothetical protein